MNKVYFGDCRDSMRQMAKDGIKVQTCITSPPYYGLRDYGTGTWLGGNPDCSHKRDSKYSDKTITGHANKDLTVGDAIYKTVCPKCGAVRKDLQLGLEETPKEYIDNLVEVFACVWDILEDDGTLWVNLGDSYYNYRPGKGQALSKQSVSNSLQDLPQDCARRGNKLEGYKEKDLMGMPWRLAFALQDFGWYLRQDIIWHKPNPMPESVKDRCTKSHEYIFLLSKKPHYYFDSESIKEPVKESSIIRSKNAWNPQKLNVGIDGPKNETFEEMGNRWVKEMANKRSVWSINTKPYSGAHFAVYPEELVEPCVMAGSKVGDIVLDPFFGSGTTGVVAQKLGRQYIGCELNQGYEQLQKDRLQQMAMELI